MSTFITLYLVLIIIHFVVDFYGQPASWVEDKNNKRQHSFKLFYHSMIHAVATGIPILFVVQYWYQAIYLCMIVGISHWVIDLFKAKNGNSLLSFVIDQFLHLLVLALIVLYILGIDVTFTEFFTSGLSSKNLLFILGYLLILKPTSILIGLILKKYELKEASKERGLLAGGEMIGNLERLLMITFIIIDQYSIIGFILAAKSIFRFGDLNKAKDHKLTEYVLIGSLLSVTITSLIGVLLKLILPST